MSNSNNNNNNYIISLLKKVVLSSIVTDSSVTIEQEPRSKTELVQEWINNIKTNIKMEENENHKISGEISLNRLQTKVNNFDLPSLELVNIMSLQENIAYEAMLVDILDIIPSNLNITVKILLHLKIITNHQMYKFNIFE
jgi:hypothetical protein